MPYRPQPQRQMPSTREQVSSQFTRADGQTATHGSFTRTNGPSPEADFDGHDHHHKVELSCGCYWPDAEVAGVCAECAREGTSANICKAHYLVCRCGTPCCWKHSHPDETTGKRICSRCHYREENRAMLAGAVKLVRRAARFVFFTSGGPPPKGT